MSVSKTIYATGSDQYDACAIPGSAWAVQHYEFDTVGGSSLANKWKRGLLYFDLSDVPYGSIFSAVTIKVYLNGNDAATNTHDFYFYRVTSDWDSYYVNYTQRDAGPTNWTSGGGDYTDLCANLGIASNEAVGWKTWEFSAAGRTVLHKMNNGEYGNYGFLLKSSTEDDNCYHTWDDPNDTYKPYMSLTYTVPGGGRTMVFF